MIPNTQQIKHRISEGTKVHKATVKDGFDIIIRLVIDIYKDPEKAVIRELVSNAVDEHVKYNVDRPIDLVIPTRASTKFSIRDYGKGLSNNRILELFPTIGESTKQDSNEAIGSFGIGRFSVFTCTDSAVITSYFEGMKTSYAWSRSSDGGVILSEPMFSGPTDEPSGLKIEFKVKDGIKSFESDLDIISYIKLPINGNVKIPQKEPTVLEGSVWSINKNRYVQSNCIMGGIKYPLKIPTKVNQLGSINLYVDIGAVDVTNNRDSLRYSKKTNEELERLSELMLGELEDRCKQEIAKQTSVLACLEKASELDKYFVINPVPFNGKEYKIEVYVPPEKNIRKRNTSRRDGNTVFSRPIKISQISRVPKIKNIVIDDLGKLSDKCIRHKYMDAGYHQSIYIFSSIEDAKEFTLVEDTSKFLIVSEYIKTIPTTYSLRKNNPKTDFDKAEIFEFKEDVGTSHHSYIKDYIQPASVKYSDKFYYAKLFRYESRSAIRYSKLKGHIDLPKIYFIKDAKVSKFPNAVSIVDLLNKKEEQVKQLEKKYKEKYLTTTSKQFGFVDRLVKNGYKNTEAVQFLEKYKDYKKTEFYEYIGYNEQRLFSPQNPTKKLPVFTNALTEEIMTCCSLTDDQLQEFANYLNYKEKQNART